MGWEVVSEFLGPLLGEGTAEEVGVSDAFGGHCSERIGELQVFLLFEVGGDGWRKVSCSQAFKCGVAVCVHC